MPEIRIVVPKEFDKYLNGIIKSGIFGNKAELVRAALISYAQKLPVKVPTGYDTSTVFSSDGRIFQVEYAVECTHRGSTTVGVRCSTGVILAKERASVTPDFPPSLMVPLKISKIDEHVGATGVGIASDLIVVLNQAVKEAETYKKETGEPIGIERLLNKLALFMQPYTVKKDVRPLGCGLFIGGVDQTGCRLFSLDPSGYYVEIFAKAAGSKWRQTTDILKQGYKSDMPFSEALGLTLKAVLKEETMKPEEIAVATIETKTKAFREVTLEEIKKAWNEIFKPKESST